MKARKILSIWVASAMLVWQVPLVAIAQEAPPETTTTETTETISEPASVEPTPAPAPAPAPAFTPETSEAIAETPPEPATGPSSPTGADQSQYTYNAETGLWESERYTWDPNTGQTAPKGDPGYYFNPATGRWDTNEYVYHPESGQYELAQPAAAPSLLSASAAPGMGGDTQQDLANALAALFGPLLGGLSNSNTGPGSDNSINADSSNTGFFDLFSRANVNNDIDSRAVTGDATVSSNTYGGSALTGAATVVANVLSLLNSAWGWAGGALNFLAKNFWGDHYGDINLNPGTSSGGGGTLGSYNPLVAGNSNTGPDSTNTIDANSNNDLTVINRPTGTITNDIDLLAQSGDAEVSKNTNAGDATSGDALAVLNLLNFINSSIASGQSFFGMLNFFGNLNGDVLFPDGFLTDALQGTSGSGGFSGTNSNTGPNSSNLIDADANNNVDITNSPEANFDNNINLAAQSGSALVQGNTNAGSALTGNAETDNNLFNLFNTSLFGQNAVLVLVNVGGTWTGQIMNLPAGANPGTSSALLTSGATLENNNTGPDSTNTIDTESNNNLNVQNSPVGNITNNVRAGAISGDATVESNTNAGNATTGDAKVVSNVANMFNSHLNLTGFFGILVVNVFGDWNGSVNKDTAAGETESAGGTSSAQVSSAGQGGGNGVSQTWRSGASGSQGGGVSGNTGSGGNTSTINSNSSNSKVLAAKNAVNEATQAAAAQTKSVSLYLILGAVFSLLGAAFYGMERRMRLSR